MAFDANKSVALTTQSMVLDNDLSTDEIVDKTWNGSKSRFTLYRELNPEDTAAKLSALDLVPLMKTCGSVAPLKAMAAQMNMTVLELPDATAPEANLELDMNRTTLEFSGAVVEFSKMMEDGRVEPHEFRDFDKKVQQFIARALGWRDSIQAKIE